MGVQLFPIIHIRLNINCYQDHRTHSISDAQTSKNASPSYKISKHCDVELHYLSFSPGHALPAASRSFAPLPIVSACAQHILSRNMHICETKRATRNNVHTTDPFAVVFAGEESQVENEKNITTCAPGTRSSDVGRTTNWWLRADSRVIAAKNTTRKTQSGTMHADSSTWHDLHICSNHSARLCAAT